MEIKNADGVRIEKTVPSELYSNYIMMGWKVVEEKKSFKSNTNDKNDGKE